MQKSIKRLSLALLALGLSAPIFADSSSPFAVTVPNQNGGFNIGLDALYLQPSAGNLSYGTVYNGSTSTTGASISGTVQTVDPTYHWGFDANIGYRIPNTGNDVNLDWTHLGNMSNSSSSFAPAGGSFEQVGGNGVTYTTQAGYANTQFQYDAVNLDAGQAVMFGDYFKFHAFTGARYANLQQKQDNIYGKTTDNVLQNTYLDQNSQFKGLGPQVGFDGRACLPYNFGLDASLTGSLLVGSIDSNASIQRIPTITDKAVVLSFTNNNNDRVVPALDGKLGVDYTINFNNADRSSMMIQAGYQVTNYFGVSNMILTNGVNSDNNVAFDGPYAGIKVMV
jgi:hypothetical protein